MRRDGLLLIEIPLDPIIQRAREYQISQVGTRHIPHDILHVAVKNERVHVSVYLRSVRGSIADPADGGPAVDEPSAGQFRITSFSADYYWSETVEIP
jgi:hypothetical protein